MTKRPILATVALVLLGAALPAAAQAASFHSELSGTTYLSGEQKAENALRTGAGAAKCLNWLFNGESIGAAVESTRLGQLGSNCKAFGRKAELLSGSCKLELTALTVTGPTRWHSPLRISCSPGASITVNVPSASCSVSFPEQLAGGVAAVENEGSGTTRQLLFSWELTGLKYVVSGPGTECGTLGAHSDGEFTGSAVIKGFKFPTPAEQVGIWAE
jgi:hypothetical protein